MQKRLVSLFVLVLLAFTVIAHGIAEPAQGPIQVVEFAQCDDDTIIVIFENTTDSIIPNFEAQLLFKDAAGTIIKTEQDGHDAVLPKSRVASTIRFPGIKKGEYASVDYLFDTSMMNDYKNHAESITINSNKGLNNVIVQVQNTADVTIDELEIACVFYKDGKIIGGKTDEKNDTASGNTVVFEFSAPRDSNYNLIEFDDFKVFINQAHTFEF